MDSPHPDPYRDATTLEVTSPYTSIVYTVGALPRAMLVAYPVLLPLYGFLGYVQSVRHEEDPKLTDAEREALRRQSLKYEEQRSKLNEEWPTLGDEVIRAFVLEARSPDGEVLELETVATTMPEFELRWLLPTVRDLTSGLTAIEREVAARKAARFRGDDNGSPPPVGGVSAGDRTVGASGGVPSVPSADSGS